MTTDLENGHHNGVSKSASEKFYRLALRWVVVLSFGIQALTIFVVYEYGTWMGGILRQSRSDTAAIQKQVDWMYVEMWILGSEVRDSTDTLITKQQEFTIFGRDRVIENHKLVMEVKDDIAELKDQVDQFKGQLADTKAYAARVKNKVENRIISPSDVAGIKQQNKVLERKYQKAINKKHVNTFRWPWEPRMP